MVYWGEAVEAYEEEEEEEKETRKKWIGTPATARRRWARPHIRRRTWIKVSTSLTSSFRSVVLRGLLPFERPCTAIAALAADLARPRC